MAGTFASGVVSSREAFQDEDAVLPHSHSQRTCDPIQLRSQPNIAVRPLCDEEVVGGAPAVVFWMLVEPQVSLHSSSHSQIVLIGSFHLHLTRLRIICTKHEWQSLVILNWVIALNFNHRVILMI